MSEVDSLREQLRERGYLTHGIERWFALDPWSSRAFWLELLTVAFKAGTLIALFAALPMTAIMLVRNQGAGPLDTMILFLLYGAVWVAAAGLFTVAVALAMKVRPALAIDTPRALLAISLIAALLLLAPFAVWWYGFDSEPHKVELAVGTALALLLFLVTTLVVSAALLSFSIYELHRIPAIHQKSRVVPISIAASGLVALLFVPAFSRGREVITEPMIVTSPSARRVALAGVDGLTYEILQSRAELRELLPHTHRVAGIPGGSAAERWASLGTGVSTADHGVRSLEGVRLRGSSSVLQRISSTDVVLRHLAPAVGLARREPLPPTVRRRDYVWEIFAKRGLPSASINWWASADDRSQAGLVSIAPDSIFAASKGEPLQLDVLAAAHLERTIERHDPRFVAVYFPALDVILNRTQLDASTRLSQSIETLDRLGSHVSRLRASGYDVVLVGLPGEGQGGAAVIASTIPLAGISSAWDVAPTMLSLLGFPRSEEMPGASAVAQQQRPVKSFGPRRNSDAPAPINEEYYENLRSLGYIQ